MFCGYVWSKTPRYNIMLGKHAFSWRIIHSYTHWQKYIFMFNHCGNSRSLAPCCHRLPGQTDKPAAQQESWITEKNLSAPPPPPLPPERGIPPVSPTDSPSRSSPARKLKVVLLTSFLWHGQDMNHILRAPGSPVSLQCRTSEPGLSALRFCTFCLAWSNWKWIDVSNSCVLWGDTLKKEVIYELLTFFFCLYS